ncbi:fasciclin domain-containing protein [Seonamhaeicola marinus]|uniref:Fasciclin domain-containing protein n=1 Tax=Seonamhaeicola marinus TaxID=1912246 RepID=A0A5D0HJY0_9FLAO|nr:fasciclin domain-containing protein [Seonamhaeicola marinus]TYA71555.1 fasciclin domain-containing protein [Seonamhaeicola marinus]
MKTLTAFTRLIVVLMITVFISSCSDDDDNNVVQKTPETITELAVATPDLSILVQALLAADGNLPAVLDDPSASFTVFAPTNAAFSQFLTDNNFASLADVPKDVLTQVLLNHVVSGEAMSSGLSTGYIKTLATEATSGANLSMYVNTSAGVTLNGVSSVSTPDISATNGVIHIVDAVIGLPSVVDFATTNDDFSILVQALTRSDLTFDYVGTLSTANGTDPAPFTVFAPTNDAFGNLLTELGANSLADIDEPTLKATLDLHAVAGANVQSSDLMDNMTVGTLGGDITANVTGGATLTDANGRVSDIVVVDVQAANGVIHVIDKVVLPNLPNTIAGKVATNESLSSLLAALQAADGDLVSILNGTTEFTVLAPSNEAFAQFLADNNFATLGDVPTDILAQVLLNHVITGSVMSGDLVNAGSGYAKTNATGAGDMNMSIYYDTSDGVKFNGTSMVTSADIDATNGVIHIVDKVIGLPSVVDHALANPSFSNLVAALSAADGDLVNVLSGDGPFTVLAPVNDGFTSFLADNNFAALGDVPTDVLAQVLLNHVLGSTTFSTDLVNAGAGYTTTSATAPGDNAMSLYFNTSDGVKFNGISTVALPDVVASNGVIHAVDKVIGLPTVVDFALADPTFSILVQALTRDDLTTDYVGLLSGTDSSPFTVFAPTDAAFVSLLGELNVAGLADIDEPTLNATLSYHAVAGANVRSSDLTDNMTVTTQGGNITANITGGATLTDANNRVSNIVAVDVQASNGVIHAIDKVVLPPLP